MWVCSGSTKGKIPFLSQERVSPEIYPPLTASDLDGLILGLAYLKSSEGRERPLTLQEKDRLIWERSLLAGHFEGDYDYSKKNLYLLILWEVYCCIHRIPCFWFLKKEGSESFSVAINVATTGRTLKPKGRAVLDKTFKEMGFVREADILSGIGVYATDNLVDYREVQKNVTKILKDHLQGGFQDRLGYTVSWTIWGDLWKMRDIPFP